jgi:hypothetical protein
VEAVRTRQATIDDLLERLLDKGIILNLDLVIGVAGIPLIAVNLRAAIASIETMIDYGLMQAWDEQLRDYANALSCSSKKLALAPEERVLLETVWLTLAHQRHLPRLATGAALSSPTAG